MSVFNAGLIARADQSVVAAAVGHLTRTNAPQWLPVGHPGATGQLPFNWDALRLHITDQQVTDVLAASSPNHCLDGWAFLARSLSGLFSGDAHAARHMAYYAQLRASLSILASVGIGIFNGVNFVVDAAGILHRLDPDAPGRGRPTRRGLGTHKITWLALSEWSRLPSSADQLLGAMRVADMSLADCLTTIWPAAGASLLTEELIRIWGYDLSMAEDEHAFRNVSSYAPHALNALGPAGSTSRPFVEQFWAALQPDGIEGFLALDRHILRHLLQLQHNAIDPDIPYEQGAIATSYSQLSSDVQAVASMNFLTDLEEPGDHPLLASAKTSAAIAEPENMAARAVMLLRIAVALCRSNFTASGVVVRNHWRPWLDDIAERRGFWALGTPVASLSDLWEDIVLALEDARGAPATTFAWFDGGALGLPRLSEAERAGLWGLCPEV